MLFTKDSKEVKVQLMTFRDGHQSAFGGKVRLEGRLTDISVGGAGMDVSARNSLNIPHEPGDEFAIHTTLPNGREIDLAGKIRTVSKKSNSPKRLQLGVQFTNLNGEDAKALKFFMLS